MRVTDEDYIKILRDDIERLSAENAKLREALRRIANGSQFYETIARAALNEETK